MTAAGVTRRQRRPGMAMRMAALAVLLATVSGCASWNWREAGRTALTTWCASDDRCVVASDRRRADGVAR